MKRVTLCILATLTISSCTDHPTESLPTRFNGQIVFGAVREEGNGIVNSDIIVIDGEGNLLKISSAVRCYSRTPDITIDGTKVAFSSCAKQYNNLFIYRTDGTGIRNITNDSAIEEFPQWSPDGRFLAFISFRDGRRDIFLMNDETGEVEKVTQSDASYWSGCWSADNNTLIYYGAASVFADQGDMYSYDLLNRVSRQLTTGGGTKMHPAIAPDGSLIAYQRDWKLHFLYTDGLGDVRVLSAPDSVYDDMHWSSCGDFLVFNAFANGRWDIYRIDRHGTGLVNLTRDSFQGYTPVISPDDAEIAYVADTHPFQKIYIMTNEGKNKRPLTKLNQREFTPSWGN
jgi:TolB protein